MPAAAPTPRPTYLRVDDGATAGSGVATFLRTGAGAAAVSGSWPTVVGFDESGPATGGAALSSGIASVSALPSTSVTVCVNASKPGAEALISCGPASTYRARPSALA